MMRHVFRLGCFMVAMIVFSPSFAGEALQHDPFARPLLPTSLSTNATPVNASVVADTPWNPILIAVMVAGKHSIVNINGVILKVGEVLDGHRLVEVKDRKAVFSKKGERVVVDMEAPYLRENNERGIQ